MVLQEQSASPRYISFRRNGMPGFGRLVSETGVAELSGYLSGAPASLREAIAGGLLGSEGDQLTVDFGLEEVELLPVIPNPQKIICVGANFAIGEVKPKPQYPVLFARFANTLVAHDAPLVVPANSPTLDFEGELAVIVGSGGRHIPEAEALDRLAGFTCFNDATVREWQTHSHQFTPAKNAPATAALGPFMVPVNAVGDHREWRILTHVNGETRQDAQLDEMIFSLAEIVAYCSFFTELASGDIIAFGSPNGFGATEDPPRYLQPGDVVVIEVGPLGRLENPVAAERSEPTE